MKDSIRRFLKQDYTVVALMAAYIVLCLTVALIDRKILIAALLLGVLCGVFLLIRLRGIRAVISRIVYSGKAGMNNEQQSVLATLHIPVLITDAREKILWYNEAFRAEILDGKEALLEHVSSALVDFSAEQCAMSDGRGVTHLDRHYTVFSQSTRKTMDDSGSYLSFFIDDTLKDYEANEYRRTRPCVLICLIDNFEELSSATQEIERSEILSQVDRVVENFVNETSGLMLRLSSRSYTLILEEQHMEEIIEGKFHLLDLVREIPTGSIPVTLSIGVGRGAKTLFENHILAKQSLNMALGRGGDQAAIKTRNGYNFYGGVARAVERRNKVRARMYANAICDAIKNSDRVLITGHRVSDLDSIGACVGMLKMATLCGVPARIVYDADTTLAKSLYDHLAEAGYRDKFVSPERAEDYLGDGSLLIVVDCHTKAMLPKASLLSSAQSTLIIDHHRMLVGRIENAAVFYHETSASSCSEMITEMLQGLMNSATERLEKAEAEALMAGIMLDTKNFTQQTGVRTFDAASYLRMAGADPTAVRKMFAVTLEVTQAKNRLIAAAQVYKNCAISVEESIVEGADVAIPQAADELLNLEGMKASIVAYRKGEEFRVSARSLGECNVQLIMEKLGGGGHQTMAGAQLVCEDAAECRKKIKEAINEYFAD